MGRVLVLFSRWIPHLLQGLFGWVDQVRAGTHCSRCGGIPEPPSGSPRGEQGDLQAGDQQAPALRPSPNPRSVLHAPLVQRGHHWGPQLDLAQAAIADASEWHCSEPGTQMPSLLSVQEGRCRVHRPANWRCSLDASELAGTLENIAQSSSKDEETTVYREGKLLAQWCTAS